MWEKIMKHSRIRKLTPVAWVLILLLVLGLGTAGLFYLKKSSMPSWMKVETKEKASGEMQYKKYKTGKNQAIVYYPKFKQKELNEVIQEKVSTYVTTFEAMNPDAETQAKLDYQAENINTEAVTLRFVWSVDNAEVSTEMMTLKTEDGAGYPLSELMRDDALKHIAFKSMPKSYDQIMLLNAYETLKSQASYYLSEKSLAFGDVTLERADIEGYFKDAKQPTQVPYVYIPRKMDRNKKLVAMTFDDGPHFEVTKKVLNLLEELGGKATFFTLGSLLEKHPEIVKSAAEKGHEIAYHSYDHPNLTTISKKDILFQINESSQKIHKILNSEGTLLLRPPYGAVNETVMSYFDNPIVNWSVDTKDWKSRNGKAVCTEIMRHTSKGDIVLMHDIYNSTYEGFECAARQLKAQGFEFVTVSELMSAYSVPLKGQKIYHYAH